MREVTLREEEGLRIWASLRDDGALVIEGRDTRQNLWGPSNDEYTLTVAASEVPTVVAALGGGDDADVLALLEGHKDEVVRAGERAWLRQAGVEPEYVYREG